MKRLLVVEDSADLQMLMKMALEDEGFKVHCASNGQEALDYLGRQQDLPDLILLDLMMPIMDGFEFRRRQLRDHHISNIPVMVLTADGSFDPHTSTLKAADYLFKPVDLDDILKTISKIL